MTKTVCLCLECPYNLPIPCLFPLQNKTPFLNQDLTKSLNTKEGNFTYLGFILGSPPCRVINLIRNNIILKHSL